MKLWYSFTKELKLASKSFYFYIEIVFAIIILVVVLFAIPENFNNRSTEYLYLDMPEPAETAMLNLFLEEDEDGTVESVEVKVRKEMIPAAYYVTSDRQIYIMESEGDLVKVAENKKQLGAVISMDDTGAMSYKYYIQGYETERLKNLYLVLHNNDFRTLEAAVDEIDIRPLSTEYEELNDREHTLPSLLTFNGSLMGMFILAAYIFLDKEQGIIKAYAVTTSPVWQYLMSKTMVVTVTGIVTTAVITIPIMGGRPNYLLMLVLLITSGFFFSSIGLLISGFYDTMTKAFNAIYLVMIAVMIPAIAYFIPSWEPFWIRLLPTYYIIQGFRESIVRGGDWAFVLLSSAGFLVVGTLLFMWATHRHKKCLTA
jgi:hypothetical protein